MRLNSWLVSCLLSLSLSLKVAKSPNLRRLSRDLLLEILDAIADYLKDCNIAVSSWWDGIFQLRGNEEFVSVKKDGICSRLKWTFGHWNLPLPTPIVYWRKDRLNPVRGWSRLNFHWKLKLKFNSGNCCQLHSVFKRSRKKHWSKCSSCFQKW